MCSVSHLATNVKALLLSAPTVTLAICMEPHVLTLAQMTQLQSVESVKAAIQSVRIAQMMDKASFASHANLGITYTQTVA